MSDDAPGEHGGETHPPSSPRPDSSPPPPYPAPPIYPAPAYPPPPVYPAPLYPPPASPPPWTPSPAPAPWQGPSSGPRFGPAVPTGPVDSLGRPMASWWQRLAAFALDTVVLAIPNTIIISLVAGTAVTTGVITSSNIKPRVWEAVGVALVVTLGYFSFLDGGGRGQTVGKMALGIAVRDIDTGGPIGAGRALLRRFIFFAAYFGLILFVINALSPLWDRRRQAWHDKITRSCVVTVR